MISFQKKLPSPLSIDHCSLVNLPPCNNQSKKILFSVPHILSPFLADIPRQQTNDLIICKPVNAILDTAVLASLANDQEGWELLRVKIQQTVASILKDPFIPPSLRKIQLNFSVEVDKKKWNTNLHKWSQTVLDQSKKISAEKCQLKEDEIPLVFKNLKNDLKIEEEIKQITNFSQLTPEKNTVFNRHRQIASIILREEFQQIYKASKQGFLN